MLTVSIISTAFVLGFVGVSCPSIASLRRHLNSTDQSRVTLTLRPALYDIDVFAAQLLHDGGGPLQIAGVAQLHLRHDILELALQVLACQRDVDIIENGDDSVKRGDLPATTGGRSLNSSRHGWSAHLLSLRHACLPAAAPQPWLPWRTD